MEVIVEFCTQNYETGSSEVREKLKQDSTIKVIEHECLNYCGDCYLQPFAMVNGKKITADTADELVEKIAENKEKERFVKVVQD